MNSFIKKNLIYFSLILILFFLVITIVLFIYPVYIKINQKISEIHDQNLELAIYKQQKENLEATKNNLNLIKDKIQNLSSIFIDKSNLIEVVEKLESTSNSNNLTQNVNITNLEQLSTDQNEIKISVILKGQWQNLLKYIEDLEKINFYINIQNLNFNKENEYLILTYDATLYSNKNDIQN